MIIHIKHICFQHCPGTGEPVCQFIIQHGFESRHRMGRICIHKIATVRFPVPHCHRDSKPLLITEIKSCPQFWIHKPEHMWFGKYTQIIVNAFYIMPDMTVLNIPEKTYLLPGLVVYLEIRIPVPLQSLIPVPLMVDLRLTRYPGPYHIPEMPAVVVIPASTKESFHPLMFVV